MTDPSPEPMALAADGTPDDAVLLQRHGRYAVLSINRPARRNALNGAVIAGLRRGLAMLREERAIRAVVIASAGNDVFCAGGDLQQMGADAPDAFDAHRERGQFAALFRDLWELGKPVIARVQGPAFAGGFGLAAACDLIVASDRASFAVPEIGVGIWPYMITAPLLQALAPRQALRLMMTGERIDAAEALRLGLAAEVTTPDGLDAAVARWIDRLSAGSPQAMALGRTAFYAALNHDAEARLRMLEALLTVNLSMPDAREGLAAFAEKRKPEWKA